MQFITLNASTPYERWIEFDAAPALILRIQSATMFSLVEANKEESFEAYYE